MMLREQLYNQLAEEFGHDPTEGQKAVMRHLTAFVLTDKPNPLYLLKGYAGTGKTSLIGALVRQLRQMRRRVVLLAPTGRAAKVLSSYSGYPAKTIHRNIYMRSMGADGQYRVNLIENKFKRAVFIVDEASMVGEGGNDAGQFVQRSLLDDLMTYVYSGEACSMILVGDHAQLPPVGVDESPTLDIDYLTTTYPLTAASFELTEVMRQSLESGILYNATRIRLSLLSDELQLPLIETASFTDIHPIQPDEFEDLLYTAFGRHDFESSIVICRSNKKANLFNQAIRSRILGYDEEINAGDLLMVVKNNYFWLEPGEAGGFIANGDIVAVNRINRVEEMYGFRFADAEVSLIDYEGAPFQVKLLLDTLMIDGPSLPFQDFQKLSAAIEEDYLDIPERRKRLAKIRTNPYYNALQIKFSYALTCHKTQGGQWPTVFVDAGIAQADAADSSYLRWLYTAATRATQQLYLIHFPDGLIG